MKMSRLIMLSVSMLAVMSLSIAGASAQDASPVATPAAGSIQLTHPAHIHEGTCDDLNPNPEFPLENPTQIEDSMVATSVTTVDVTIEDLLAAPHAVNVHESPENAANYVA